VGAHSLDAFVRVTGYDECREVLRSPGFRQASKQESAPLVGETVLTLDGDEHAARRRLLTPLFARAALRDNERDVLAPTVRRCLADLAAERDSDGLARCDLVRLSRTVFLQLAAATIGLDGVVDQASTDRLRPRLAAAARGQRPPPLRHLPRGRHSAAGSNGSNQGGTTMTEAIANPLAERTIIHVDDLPWVPYADETGFIPDGAAVKPLLDPSTGHTFMLTRFSPHFRAPSHWHPSDTIYIITKGEFGVEGEGVYRPGDVRWVRGGTAYGSETAGADGCEFYIVSLGEFDVKDPGKEAPPRGHWHEQPPA
jgi:hypothetical protein